MRKNHMRLLCLLLSFMIAVSPCATLADTGTMPGTTTSTGTLLNAVVATGASSAVDVGGLSVLAAQVTIVTTATVRFEGSLSATGPWTPILGMNFQTGATATTTTASGLFQVSVAGLKWFRFNVTAWTAGAVTASATGTSTAGSINVSSTSGSGTSCTNLVKVGGTCVTVGSKVSACSIPVVVASNQGAISVKQSAAACLKVCTCLTAQNTSYTCVKGTAIMALVCNCRGGFYANHTMHIPMMDGKGTLWARVSNDVGHGCYSGCTLRVVIACNQPKVKVYQTTAACLVTTVGAALPAGANNIGKVTICGAVTGPVTVKQTVAACLVTTAKQATAACLKACVVGTVTAKSAAAACMLVCARQATANNLKMTPIQGTQACLKMTAFQSAAACLQVKPIQTTAACLVVTVGAALPAGCNTVGKVIPITCTTSSGWTRFSNTALSNTVVSVKASAGKLGYVNVVHNGANPVYLQIFNVASGSVTLGVTTPDLSFEIPSNATAANGSGWSDHFGIEGFPFSTAISVALTSTSTGAGAPSANAVVVIGYK